MDEIETYEIAVLPEHKGKRLDKVLADALPDFSRNRLKSLIIDGGAVVEGRTIADPSHRVKPGKTVILSVPHAEELDLVPQDIPLTIAYEDEHLIVVDKPAGMVVHPAPGNEDGTLVNAILHHCGDSLLGIGGVKRPGIVHRIDKDTSGLIVIAKDDQTHTALSAKFKAKDMERRYQAVVWGLPNPTSGRIEGNIGRHPVHRKLMAVVKAAQGKHAVTHYKTLEAFGTGAALVECQLETGRTHQIRVHMTHIGHPLMGDPVYGRSSKTRRGGISTAAQDYLSTFNRQALHAKILGFDHPISGEKLSFESDLPNDIKDLMISLRHSS
ncbi:RluA family pseudouridine synthase [Aestuariispira insulae]|uniref:Pseudouridine synthase n=1 Tax=Aestuariispira insulae TaxID=1461337 RepID=A0A3D9HXK8_9PROT|nr:RluA family pseudouridine synthase [Aestuariispira insulae]RED53636.1 RluA family pseudouridine synthase [Aestuariispira insulae]